MARFVGDQLQEHQPQFAAVEHALSAAALTPATAAASPAKAMPETMAKPASAADEPRFRRLISMAFAQKRKTLHNNLKSVMPDADSALETVGIDPGRRAETLTLAEWVELYQVVEKKS